MVSGIFKHQPYRTDLLVSYFKFRPSPVGEYLNYYYNVPNDYWAIPEKIQTEGESGCGYFFNTPGNSMSSTSLLPSCLNFSWNNHHYDLSIHLSIYLSIYIYIYIYLVYILYIYIYISYVYIYIYLVWPFSSSGCLIALGTLIVCFMLFYSQDMAFRTIVHWNLLWSVRL